MVEASGLGVTGIREAQPAPSLWRPPAPSWCSGGVWGPLCKLRPTGLLLKQLCLSLCLCPAASVSRPQSPRTPTKAPQKGEWWGGGSKKAGVWWLTLCQSSGVGGSPTPLFSSLLFYPGCKAVEPLSPPVLGLWSSCLLTGRDFPQEGVSLPSAGLG